MNTAEVAEHFADVIFNNLPLMKTNNHFDNNEEAKTQVKEFKKKDC